MSPPPPSSIWTLLIVMGILLFLIAGCMIFGLTAFLPDEPGMGPR